jgi:hypothetical protein
MSDRRKGKTWVRRWQPRASQPWWWRQYVPLNTGLLQDYMALYPRSLSSSYLLPWEPEISQIWGSTPNTCAKQMYTDLRGVKSVSDPLAHNCNFRVSSIQQEFLGRTNLSIFPMHRNIFILLGIINCSSYFCICWNTLFDVENDEDLPLNNSGLYTHGFICGLGPSWRTHWWMFTMGKNRHHPLTSSSEPEVNAADLIRYG